MYGWRKMSPQIRELVLQSRKLNRRPWHNPPHQDRGEGYYHISAACYEHRPLIGTNVSRMKTFSEQLLILFQELDCDIASWCVLPNHYHVLLQTKDIKQCLRNLKNIHGVTAFNWNQEDQMKGRKVWYNYVDRKIRSGRHFWATMNYVHNQPVHHGYVKKWGDWPYGSAVDFMKQRSREELNDLWRRYPIMDYGKGWDDPEI